MILPRRSFVLLDVILAIMILGVTVATALRAFHQSVTSVKRGEIMARAAMYAEAKLQEFDFTLAEAEDLPEHLEGRFSAEFHYDDEETFADAESFHWEAEFEEIEIDYPHVRLSDDDEERTQSLRLVTLRILYDDGARGWDTWAPLEVETCLLGNDRLSRASRQQTGSF